MLPNTQPNKFLYRLIVGTTPYNLVQSPIGWEENLINFKRDSKYHGIIRSFTTPLEFISEGAKILRSQYYQDGTEAYVRLELLENNPKTWEYESLFIGEIDFSKAEDKINSFTVNVMEGGIAKLIKAYEGVQYEIPLDDGVLITIPGVGVSESSNSIFNVLPSTIWNNFYPQISLVNNGLISGFITAQTTELKQALDYSNFFAKVNNSVKFRLSGSIKGFTTYDKVIIGLIKSTNDTDALIIDALAIVNAGYFDANFDVNIDGTTNDKYFVKLICSGLPSIPYTQIHEGTLNISYSAVTSGSTAKMISPKKLLESILQRMNNNTPVNVSSYLFDNTDAGRIYATSGNGIREISGSRIKTSLNDFFKSYSSILGAGMGIDSNGVTFESLPYFFTGLKIADLGSVKDCVFTPATEYLYSSLKVGYKDQKYDTVDGKDEFNSGQVWSLPITRTQKELDLTAVYRADVRGIEDIKQNLIGVNKDTIDSDKDNDVFIIKLNSALTAPEPSSIYQSVTGVNSPERMYNLDLSPKKNLLRNSPLLASSLYFLDKAQIVFESSDKNADLSTIDLSGRVVKEYENININELSGEIFIPVIAEFTSIYDKSLQELIKSNPYGYISFTYLDNEYKGYILECSTDESKNSATDFKLLLTSSNKILNLIH